MDQNTDTYDKPGNNTAAFEALCTANSKNQQSSHNIGNRRVLIKLTQLNKAIRKLEVHRVNLTQIDFGVNAAVVFLDLEDVNAVKDTISPNNATIANPDDKFLVNPRFHTININNCRFSNYNIWNWFNNYGVTIANNAFIKFVETADWIKNRKVSITNSYFNVGGPIKITGRNFNEISGVKVNGNQVKFQEVLISNNVFDSDPNIQNILMWSHLEIQSAKKVIVMNNIFKKLNYARSITGKGQSLQIWNNNEPMELIVQSNIFDGMFLKKYLTYNRLINHINYIFTY